MLPYRRGHGAQRRHALLRAFDTLNDFAPFSMIAAMPFALFVNNQVPAKGVPEFLALAKAQPGKLTFGGAESTSLLAGACWRATASWRATAH